MTLTALLAPHDKTGIADFARGLSECGVALVATEGTRRHLAEHGIAARAVGEVTGVGEMLDGRVKTLHPAIFAGILARRDRPAHLDALRERGFSPIDIVVVSLYPFRETVEGGAGPEEAVEMIDIGGPAMIRAAAKNGAFVAVLVSPTQYDEVLAEIRDHGTVQPATRQRLAARAFAHVAAYDAAIANYLRGRVGDEDMPEEWTTGGRRLAVLRYGENPHQRGAVYEIPGARRGLAHGRLLQGSALSFTNWLDTDAAWRIVGDFQDPAAVVVKHTNPCGFAVADDLASAYRKAFEGDPRSAFGGIVGLNRPLDAKTARALTETFLEAVVVPAIDEEAIPIVATKPRLRVLVVDGPRGGGADALDVRSIDGGLLVQTGDVVRLDRAAMVVATKRAPTEDEWRDLLVAWPLCRHVKSNAVVVVRDRMAVGVGAGQMSRVEAAELAVRRAGERCPGAVAASDAFFPFPDGLEVLGRAGVTAVIHPGGSRQDAAVVAAADALGMAVVHTGERHFRH